jgi:hypothetical protein
MNDAFLCSGMKMFTESGTIDELDIVPHATALL